MAEQPHFLDGPPPLAFAHRGYAPDGCENSLAAFQRAVDLGYTYLETDVRVTADGVALAFHDNRLDRVTDLTGPIDELPWSRVRQALIGGREPIPRLADLLGAWPHTRINIDVKAAAGVAPTIEAIRSTGTVDRVCVGAFSESRVAAVRRVLGPRLCTALGPAAALRLKVGRAPAGTAGRCAQVPARIGRRPFVDARYVTRAHALGIAVHVWTVNDRADMERLLNLGVDGIMTDEAEVLKDVLVARGHWPG